MTFEAINQKKSWELESCKLRRNQNLQVEQKDQYFGNKYNKDGGRLSMTGHAFSVPEIPILHSSTCMHAYTPSDMHDASMFSHTYIYKHGCMYVCMWRWMHVWWSIRIFIYTLSPYCSDDHDLLLLAKVMIMILFRILGFGFVNRL